ncbi:MAG: ATP-binding protein [Janthinobacterium lividum]
MSVSAGMAAIGAAILDRLRRSGDREHEMLGNRLAIGALVSAYILAFIAGDTETGRRLTLLCGAYCLGALLLLLHPLLWPGPSRLRRVAAVFTDVGGLSCSFYLGDASASPLFAMYLWVILGNGFRFGLPWLYLSMGASFLGFGVVVLCTPYWLSNLPLGLGLLVGLLVIPLYAGQLIRKLSHAKKQAEEASRAKSLFLASVSHELRTPLNAVTGMTGLLAATSLTAEQQEMTGTIDAASRTLLSLIDGILDLSRIEAGKMPVASAPFDLAEVLMGVMDMVAVRAREKGLRTALHITSRSPLDVIGDSRHLTEILLNLVSNAVKFTPAGVVILAADIAPCAGSGFKLRIEVTDTGIGIAPEAQVRIFNDFVQADGTIINRFGGTGLGLAITSRLVALHGGEIELESSEGQGSTFAVTLPIAVADPVAQHPDHAGIVVGSAEMPELRPLLQRLEGLGCTVAGPHDPAQPSSAGGPWLRLSGQADDPDNGGVLVAEPGDGLPAVSLRQRFATIVAPDAPEERLQAALRIAAKSPLTPTLRDQAVWVRTRPLHVLIADDNVVNTRVLDLVLRRAGHTTIIVGDGEQALDAMNDQDFDVVLMDLNMPVMTGSDAAKLYRFGAIGRPHLPIIGLTADVTNEVQRRCLDAGMDRCLLKPIEPGILLDALDALTGAAEKTLPAAARSMPAAVTDIAAHPRFRHGAAPAVNMATIIQLRDLGGDDFLESLIGDFLADAGRLRTSLARATQSGDMAAVAAQAHALYSASGNMGAEPMRQICRALQGLSRADMRGDGQHMLDALTAELARVGDALEAVRTDRGPRHPVPLEMARQTRTSPLLR